MSTNWTHLLLYSSANGITILPSTETPNVHALQPLLSSCPIPTTAKSSWFVVVLRALHLNCSLFPTVTTSSWFRISVSLACKARIFLKIYWHCKDRLLYSSLFSGLFFQFHVFAALPPGLEPPGDPFTHVLEQLSLSVWNKIVRVRFLAWNLVYFKGYIQC